MIQFIITEFESLPRCLARELVRNVTRGKCIRVSLDFCISNSVISGKSERFGASARPKCLLIALCID